MGFTNYLKPPDCSCGAPLKVSHAGGENCVRCGCGAGYEWLDGEWVPYEAGAGRWVVVTEGTTMPATRNEMHCSTEERADAEILAFKYFGIGATKEHRNLP